MSLPWTAEQCQWLRAMGHAVFVRGTPLPEAADDADIRTPAPERGSNARSMPANPTAHPQTERAAERARRRPPVAPPDEPARPSEVATPSAGLRTLHRALLRAAGQRTARAAEAVLAELGVDTAAVQGDAAAKRALWVRLRARRRQGSR